MFVPDDAKVKDKMLYASTRDSLKRDLGYSFFAADMHVTERSELSFDAFDKKVLVNEAERRSVMSDVEKLRIQARHRSCISATFIFSGARDHLITAVTPPPPAPPASAAAPNPPRRAAQEDSAERVPMSPSSYIHAVKFPLSEPARRWSSGRTPRSIG